MVSFSPNWAAIASVLGSAVAAPRGQWAQGAQMGAQNYQSMQDAQIRRQLQEQSLQLAQEEAEARRAENQRKTEMEAQWKAGLPKLFGGEVQAPANGMSQAQFGGAPTEQTPGLFSDLDPTRKALLQQALQYASPGEGAGFLLDYATKEPKQNEMPSDVQEYQFAVSQGYPGTFFDYQNELRKAGASNASTTIYNKDYGNIPPGFRLVETPQGVMMEAVPGSPAATEAQAGQQKEQAKEAQKQVQGDVVLTDIGRALDLAKNYKGLSPTGVGSLLKDVPATNANDMQNLLLGIQSSIGFDRLQQMRDNSPTGGALGPVSDFENKNLQAAYGSLAQSQTVEQFEFNLRRLANIYMDIVHGPGGGPPRYELGATSNPGNDLKSKYGLE